MKARDEKDPERCPTCKGAGRVLLLFSWKDCGDCRGTGKFVDENAETGQHSIVSDESPETKGSGEGSGATSRCDPEDDPDYFDDGLEFDDHGAYGDGDGWGAGDGCTDLWEGED